VIFNLHSDLRDGHHHAFLSPSNYHWLRYTDERLEKRFITAQAARRGSDIHDFAHEAIRLGIKLAKSNRSLATYVYDGIGYRMACEQPLYYSENCFGTADTICFRRNKLRIHDLKTGVSPTSMEQLEVYAALFCLEYGYNPFDISIECRIYQGEDIKVHEPFAENIAAIMEKIVASDLLIREMKASDNY
jgi:Protein of unknown function (DUF2800)